MDEMGRVRKDGGEARKGKDRGGIELWRTEQERRKVWRTEEASKEGWMRGQ